MHLTAASILLCHFQILLLYIDVRFDIKYRKRVGCRVNRINIKQDITKYIYGLIMCYDMAEKYTQH